MASSVVSPKFVCIRPPMHPAPRRCSSVKYSGILPPRALPRTVRDVDYRALGATTNCRDATLGGDVQFGEARHGVDERLRIDRLGEVQVEAGLERALAIFVAREGGERRRGD